MVSETLPLAVKLSHTHRVNRCIIFDLDGTLVDSLPGIAHSLNHCLAAHGHATYPEDTVRGFVGDGLENLVRRAAAPASSDAEIAAMIATFKRHYAHAWQTGTIPYPGIPELLATLHAAGLRLAVLSNKTHAFTTEIAREIFPTIPFSSVLGQRDGTPHKPHPHGALEISREVNVPPHHCMVVGDATIDLETAANAGMEAISVTWGYHDTTRLLAAGATSLVETPVALLAQLQSWFAPASSPQS